MSNTFEKPVVLRTNILFYRRSKVLVKGKEVNIKSVELEDNSGKCRLTLWRNHADSNVAVGSYVRATELVVQTYKEEKSLSTTYKTKLAVSNNAVILHNTFSRKKPVHFII